MMIGRVLRAAQLDAASYEEVEADSKGTLQAAAGVVLVGLATGIGALGRPGAGLTEVVLGLVLGIVGWATWAGVTYYVGTRFLATAGTTASWSELARTTGFAQAPGLLRVLGPVPVLGWIALAVSIIWQFAAMLVAVRQALDFQSTLRAAAVVLIGFPIYGAGLGLLLMLTGETRIG